MNTISASAESARESARQSDGRFGAHAAGESGATLHAVAVGSDGVDERETIYQTRDEAYERGILPVLGDFADDYDHDGLSRDLVGSDESGFWAIEADEDTLERHCFNMEDHHVEAFIEEANRDAPPNEWVDTDDFTDEIDEVLQESFTYHRDLQAKNGVSLTHAHYDHYSMVTRAQCEESADRAKTQGTPYFIVTAHDGKTYGSSGSIDIYYPEGHPRDSGDPYTQIALDEDDWGEDGEPINENIRARLIAGDGTYAYAAEDEDLTLLCLSNRIRSCG